MQGEILEEVAENGYGTSKSVESACSGEWKHLALKWKKSYLP